MVDADLKLLVDVGWKNRHGQRAVFVFPGQVAAARRLIKRGLLVEVNSVQVGITNDGEKLLNQLSAAARRGSGLRRVK